MATVSTPLDLGVPGSAPDRRGLALAAGVIGFALGGFFDGITLHQVLQWHHFLSLVDTPGLRTMEAQILADGLFHVAVYAIAAVGLALLWRARGGFRLPGSDRRLLGAALLGFAAWQFTDVVVFHWLVGIHRIRVDTPNPLLWDLGWLAVLGVPPLLLGLRLWRRGGGGSGGGRAAALLALAVLAAAPVAARPDPGATATLVLFAPGTGPVGSFAAVAAAGGRVLWSSPSGNLVAVDLSEGRTLPLFRGGALLVGSSALSGCLGWVRT